MKKAYYFSHDSNAKTDEKILNLRADMGWDGYGIYWALIETLHDSTGYKFAFKSLQGLSINLGVKREKLEKIINSFGLFEKDENFFWSNSLMKRMNKKKEVQESYSNRGKKGAEAKKEKNSLSPDELMIELGLSSATAELKQGKEKKEKEIEKESSLMKDLSIDRCKMPKDSTGYLVIESSIKLYKGFAINFPDNRDLPLKTVVEWVPPIRNLIEKKKYTYAQIKEIIIFASEDKFWKKVIIDTETLDRNFEKLKINYEEAHAKQH